jgi:pantoate--beta-alanine ligase
MTRIIRSPQDFMAFRKTVDKSVGFVPTMGALHEGHEELLKRARKENEIVVLSIFVNPTQFNDPHDFEKYPMTWEADFEMAERSGVDAVFAPTKDVMYPDNYKYKVSENDLSLDLCGKDRPGHFDGVLSVVMKLFNVVRPSRAYFGEKDFQQLHLIKGMVDAFFMDLTIVPVATVREESGLALSSRNTRLSQEERLKKAPLIYKRITEGHSAEEARRNLENDGFKVDYVTDFGHRRFVAAKLGDVRLIDNVELDA